MNAVLSKLNARIDAAGTLVCVGLDPDPATMPASFRNQPEPLFRFCRHIVEQTAAYAAAFKPNVAFFEAYGAAGVAQLQSLANFLRATYPQIVSICDAKRGDTANTSAAYARGIFDEWGFDAVTLNPYMGSEALAPFLERDDKACIVLCRTSNPGARELQDMDCGGAPLWQRVAERVTRTWDRDGNCWLVAGATYPAELAALRAMAPCTPLLVPGVGAQGGDAAAVLRGGLDANGRGLVVSSSRAILTAADPAHAALQLRDEVNAIRHSVRGATT